MNLLAIETATESCSVALLSGERLCARSEFAPRRHAELLLPMCDAVLAEAGMARRALSAVAFGRGPGAFTGVRLAAAAAQGIAFAFELPVIPVSSLAALALQASDDGAPILAAIDARMGEVYAGWFRRTPDGLLEAIAAETVGPVASLAIAINEPCHVIGSGWATYATALAAHLPQPPRSTFGDALPQAVDVARLAAPMLRRGLGLPAEQALPVYLRDKVALTVAEQQAGRAGRA
ncbi:MAG: tRNA (adenosine(37)-N6)-threonylcarbamoyltransferase complex dimerization subunit type 1 TsaB [Dokdonella sp.]|uniref:tRNA (adenosine(37)-N6)-threonylcarbamoyltransferase complex dimerization subunit type 1 TsaB n=1 Tax=Dokdonella sp. TaxID=2291710 RepID=UPI0025C1CB93|nr:tRNA (adenosine(37)-N6)-threonylcarbamoyltransferase complex dimerization subunit type 1 TsaB [Dokdonella sp.]MBZ0222794.1 tRNA (adenosine(37)-N6)-threonylcarbamoyltransferase complex dimerization subunit type 1 TsaB [Dokdonella sp.]MCC7254677.1 tRNA (adenosine(37)-N6)-threonylcarbamoyltransferase complex dimerization subunit type 1 TsaB [Dokdonella sp.]